jgi:hypothetical protein
MTKFVARTKGRTNGLMDPMRLAVLNKAEMEQFHLSLSELLARKRMPKNAGEARIQKNISMGATTAELKPLLSSLCQQDTELIRKICRQNDRLYGLSSIPQARLLVEHSNAMSVLRQKGRDSSCLKRFTDVYSNFEEPYSGLEDVFQFGIMSILERKGRYRQGPLFLFGALKEFDDKGLADILKPVEEKPIEKPVVAAVKKTEEPKIAVIAATPVVEKAVSIPRPIIVEESKKTLSQFELAVSERNQKSLPAVAVNMPELKLDFPFSEQMVMSLYSPMQQFQTRKALQDMKKFDKLGTKGEPVRLIFLKYLIDHDFHQGLFNITAILGERFWVINDIDKKKSPEYVRLVNDETTNNRWQIYVLSPPSQEEEVKDLKSIL